MGAPAPSGGAGGGPAGRVIEDGAVGVSRELYGAVDVASSSVSLEQVTWRLASGNARLVVIGDSFAAPQWNRVFPSVVREWGFGRLGAITAGASDNSQLSRGVALAFPVLDVQASPGNYRVFKTFPPYEHFALPVRGIREFGGPVPSTLGEYGRLLELSLWNGQLSPGDASGQLLRPDESGRVRYLYFMPEDMSRAWSLHALRTQSRVTTADLFTGARRKRVLGEDPADGATTPTGGQMNAYWRDLEVPAPGEGSRSHLWVEVGEPYANSGLFSHPAGAVWYRGEGEEGEWAGGLYYSYLADSSWSYEGFWADREAVAVLDKHVSTEQVAHWLDVTTLDPDQPVIFVYYLAAERPRGGATFVEQFEAMAALMRRASRSAGLGEVFHLFVLPHYHEIGDFPDEEARAWFDEQRAAMFEVAAKRPDVAAASIYDATGRLMFDGSADARDWLRANGYGSFSYAEGTVDLADGEGIEGVLLDGLRLHPDAPHSAAFFAQRLAMLLDVAVREPDVDGDGRVTVEDLYAQVRSPQDLNGDGVADGADAAALEAYLRREERWFRRR